MADTPSASNSATASEAVAADGPKTYTLEDLAANGTSDKFYMLLHDKVYDVTKFLDEHPGGDEVMLAEAGRDATEAFEDVGHSDEAREQLAPMLLGEFKGEKKAKKEKKVSIAGSSTTGGGGSSLTYLIPLALLGAFLAWRFILA